MKKSSGDILLSLFNHRHKSDGLELLNKVKKDCNCTTDDILIVQSKNSVTPINVGDRVVYSHTTIYDFGINSDDIRNSRLNECQK